MRRNLILITFLFIFTACSNNAKLYSYTQDSNQSDPKAWDALLIDPSNYPENTQTTLKKFYPFIFSYQKYNPGFVDIKKFQATLPNHPLSSLKSWYVAHFYQYNYTLGYMVMEFRTTDEAKEYLPRLRQPYQQNAIKLLRYKNFLVSLQIRDLSNSVVPMESTPKLYAWIEDKIASIKSQL